jgi:hypothetical protein
MSNRSGPENPLRRLEDWEDFVETRYPATAGKPREDYRKYDNPARDTARIPLSSRNALSNQSESDRPAFAKLI